ncbi:MAG: DUF2191 domain-containing protein [Opitutales bacterium]
MKTTIEISDNLLAQAKQLAREQNTTLRSIVEEGLVKAMQERSQRPATAIQPVVFGGKGLKPEFKEASWQAIREVAYEGHGG